MDFINAQIGEKEDQKNHSFITMFFGFYLRFNYQFEKNNNSIVIHGNNNHEKEKIFHHLAMELNHINQLKHNEIKMFLVVKTKENKRRFHVLYDLCDLYGIDFVIIKYDNKCFMNIQFEKEREE